MTIPTTTQLNTLVQNNLAAWVAEGLTVQNGGLLADGFPTTPHIYNLLINPVGSVANPTPQPKLPTHYMLTDEDLGRLFGLTRGTAIVTWLTANNPTLLKWMEEHGVDTSLAEVPADLAGLVAAGGITQAESDTILALGSVGDSGWSSTVPGPSLFTSAGYSYPTLAQQESQLPTLINQALNRAAQ